MVGYAVFLSQKQEKFFISLIPYHKRSLPGNFSRQLLFFPLFIQK